MQKSIEIVFILCDFRWECPDAPNVTANIICTACGGAGHISRDCKNPRPGFGTGDGAGMDDEVCFIHLITPDRTNPSRMRFNVAWNM
jgi:hypothetical protein